MRTTITKYRFVDTFKQNEAYKDNFTVNGLVALFEYLEELEKDTGEEIELDVVALCGEYEEHASLQEFVDNYFLKSTYEELTEGCESEEEKEEAIREFLQKQAILIEFDSGIIISQF